MERAITIFYKVKRYILNKKEKKFIYVFFSRFKKGYVKYNNTTMPFSIHVERIYNGQKVRRSLLLEPRRGSTSNENFTFKF